MQKHAFLIAAHHEFELLEKLIILLDHPNHDIYLHVSQTAGDFDEERFRNLTKYSKVYFVQRIKVAWGGFSQIRYEMTLLKAAVKGDYDYYHLLSGVDLPIKSMDYIHDFFEKNAGKELIHFCSPESTATPAIYKRVSVYHLLQEWVGREEGLLWFVEKVLIKLQEMIGVNRIRGHMDTIGYGCNWFSITHQLAYYLVEREEEINSRFRFCFCGDEVFLQTMFRESPFRENAYVYDETKPNSYQNCMRYVDWERGKPYVFRLEDFDDLISSPYLFARKFDIDVDREIIDRIFDYFTTGRQANESGDPAGAGQMPKVPEDQ